MIYLPLLMLGCSDSLKDEWDWNDTPLEDTSEPENDDGPLKTKLIDASDRENWVYFDIEENEMVEVVTPENDLSWDLGFMRTNIKLNSGVHGEGNVEAAPLELDFDSFMDAPADGYLSDFVDEEGVTQYVFKDWYIYNPQDHSITPAEIFYVVRSRNAYHYKLRIVNYYNSSGTSGMPTIQWEEILPPTQ